MLAKLISIDGDRPIVLAKDVTVVGRKRGVCDVYIDRSSVSKLHCVIVKTDGLLFIRDLGSTNGTKVAGVKVAEREVGVGYAVELRHLLADVDIAERILQCSFELYLRPSCSGLLVEEDILYLLYILGHRRGGRLDLTDVLADP